MKTYANGKKATSEFTKAQMWKLSEAIKSHAVTAYKWVLNEMWNIAKFYGLDNNGSAAYEEQMIAAIIEDFENGNLDAVQKEINKYTESLEEVLSSKITRNKEIA